MDSTTEFLDAVKLNRANAALLERLASLDLCQCFLVAGSLFQSYWNKLSGFPPENGIKDYDIFYFDDRDISWEAEDAAVKRVSAIAADLGIEVDVKNQARVHLWYEGRFGYSYPRLRDCTDGIDRYLVGCTCVGIDVRTGRLYVPAGLVELRAGLLRRNPKSLCPVSLFEAKARSYQKRWPWLRIVDEG